MSETPEPMTGVRFVGVKWFRKSTTTTGGGA